MNKMILTDCDGVLLNWEYAFDIWMEQRGIPRVLKNDYDIKNRYNISKLEAKSLIRLFNESAAIGFLPPLRDAMYYVKKLHEEHGYVFRVITSLSNNLYAQKLREKNLDKLFGTAIDSVICLDTGADKDEALMPYKDSEMFWIEDKEENAELGQKMGLNALLIEHEYNMNNVDIPLMRNWKEVYNRIVGA